MSTLLTEFFQTYFHSNFYPYVVALEFSMPLRSENAAAQDLHSKAWFWDAQQFQYIANDTVGGYYPYSDRITYVDFIHRRTDYVRLQTSFNRKIIHWDIYSFDELFLLGEMLPARASEIKTLENLPIINC